MADGSALTHDLQHIAAARPRIEIGLVNNMPDAALVAAERRFAELLDGSDLGLDVRLRLFSLSGVERGARTRQAMADRYRDIAALKTAGLDAIIVTGAEPRTPDLRAEPYWDELANLIDWARTGTLSALWSCLAAHAAVLRLDGIERQPLAKKCSGVFACERVADHPLVAGMADGVTAPHSRRNDLPVGDLVAHGYQMLTRSAEIGADVFVREEPSLFVFFQGHPEYAADALLLEYCRDVGRHLRGQQAQPPAPPVGYFDPTTEAAFRDLAEEAIRAPSSRLMRRCAEIAAAFKPRQTWREPARMLFRNWVGQVAAAKGVGRALK
jgi:homoserine O-succinyltransferase